MFSDVRLCSILICILALCCPGTVLTSTVKPTSPTKPPTQPVPGSCLIPNNPEYGEFSIPDKASDFYKPGSYVPPYTQLKLNCKNKFKIISLQSSPYSFCAYEQWSPPPGTCPRPCPSIHSTVSTKVLCTYNKWPLDSCEDPVEGTIATLSCEPLYEEPGLERNPTRICKNGSWDSRIPECLPSHIGKFQCKSGQYINKEESCDGKPQCDDNSDETEEECSKNTCPPSIYTCKYGGCVAKDARCNGTRECFDGSDEAGCPGTVIPSTVKLTSPTKPPTQPVPGSCLIPNNPEYGEFSIPDKASDFYKPGSYVPQFSVLTLYCKERFKMTPPGANPDSVCTNGQWSPPPGTCALSCRSIHSTMSTKVECMYNGRPLDSCENPVEGTIATLSCEPFHEEPGLARNPTRFCKDGSWDFSIPECILRPGSCLIPNNPQHGEFSINDKASGFYKPGSYVPQFSALKLNCKERFKIIPPQANPHSVCINGQWSPPPATCARTCPSIHSTVSTKVECTYNRWPLDSCEDPVEGTIATLSCEPLYEEPGLERDPTRICKYGSWDFPISECLPMCGVKRPVGQINIIGGKIARHSDYPWQVAIYTADKNHICGGSILNQRVILSAAHCFTNNDDGRLKPKENYLIGAGKYYRTYDDDRDKKAQYSKIDAIYIPEGYKVDIAVVILETKLNLSIAVQPVCVDWFNNFEYVQLSENNFGVVTGWGSTVGGDKPSEELKELKVPYISLDQCFEQVPEQFRIYLSSDKICAEYLNNGTAVCNLDSGGGLTFQHVDDKYYIRGVVSTSPASEGESCDSNKYGTYTLVSKYIDFIRTFEIQNRA